MTRRLALAILAVLATAMITTAAHAADPREIPITIANNTFSPEEIKVKAGEPFVLVAAGLFSTGGDALWDTSGLLRDDSVVGGFISGLTGYRARPSAPEVIAYAVYVIGAILLLFTPSATAPAANAARPSAGALS